MACSKCIAGIGQHRGEESTVSVERERRDGVGEAGVGICKWSGKRVDDTLELIARIGGAC
jgi:hypothetical protein